MTAKLTWTDGFGGCVRRPDGMYVTLAFRPALSFPFVAVDWRDQGHSIATETLGAMEPATPEQEEAIATFCQQYADFCASEVYHTVDDQGAYIGLQASGHRVPCAPPVAACLWDFTRLQWVAVKTLDELKVDAHTEIDSAAGAARLLHITDVPGQQAVYVAKEQQARAYAAAGFEGPIPLLVQAEADAAGMTPGGAAQRIIAIADAWAMASASIERKRIAGKLAVTAATTKDAVAQALSSAIYQLGQA